MMLAILLMLAGLALILGAKDLAGRFARGAIGAVLIMTALPWLIQACICPLPGVADGFASVISDLSGLIALAALAVIGFVAWRRRVDRTRASELWAKRNGTPRARALPAAPASRGGEGSI